MKNQNHHLVIYIKLEILTINTNFRDLDKRLVITKERKTSSLSHYLL